MSDVLTILCSVRRSGTHLFNDLMRAAGAADIKEDYVNSKDLTPNDVVLKVRHRAQFAPYYGVDVKPEHLTPQASSQAEYLDQFIRAFGASRVNYVFLERRDKVRQAVSSYRAQWRQQWLSYDAPELDYGVPYHADEITRHLDFVAKQWHWWYAYFDTRAISPYHIYYEDLYHDEARTMRGVLSYIGHGEYVNTDQRPTRQSYDTEDVILRYKMELLNELDLIAID